MHTNLIPVRSVNARLLIQKCARGFELYDQHSPQHVVRLATYLGRHAIVIVFFDGAKGADGDPNLVWLRDHFQSLATSGDVVFGISNALPQENRKAIERSGQFPFALLSDPGLAVRRQWGRLDAKTAGTIPGVFLIDRAGDVAWSGEYPQPLDDPQKVFNSLLHGR